MNAEDLLREARTMIQDMDNGWPTRELHRPPAELIAEITALLHDGWDAPHPDNLIIEDDAGVVIVYFTDEGTISAPEMSLGLESVTYRADDPDEMRQALLEGGREAARRRQAGSLR